jgi:dCTP deaminase
MILSDKRILEEIEKGNFLIEPFKREYLGTNSYDVHLGRYLATYKDRVLDAREHNKIDTFEIPMDGYVLQPGTLYLGVTAEYTETHAHVPFLEGKSSTGIFMLLQVKVMWDFATPGHLKYPYRNL